MNRDINRTHDLTIAEIQACPLFRDLTDEQAAEVIETIKRFTQIIFEASHTIHH